MGGLTYTALDAVHLSTAEIYGKVLTDLAKDHPEIVALTADLQKSTKISVFADTFPNRFFNVGIAEQNMVGIAAGMANAGLIPFVTTFSIFASMRALEQLRTDICYQNLNAKIIATHGGLSFGQAGTTHQTLEDIAITRSIPNLKVIVPADGMETANAIIAAYETSGPVYIRINRGFDRRLYNNTEYGFKLGEAIELHQGTDITIIATGVTVYHALEAAKILDSTDGIKVRVLNIHTIKPIDKEAILKALQDTRRIITAEDHNIIGGLGGAVAEVIAESGKACAFKRLGIQDKFSIIGLHDDLLAFHKIDTSGLVENVRELMGKDFEEDEDWDDEV